MLERILCEQKYKHLYYTEDKWLYHIERCSRSPLIYINSADKCHKGNICIVRLLFISHTLIQNTPA